MIRVCAHSPYQNIDRHDAGKNDNGDRPWHDKQAQNVEIEKKNEQKKECEKERKKEKRKQETHTMNK